GDEHPATAGQGTLERSLDEASLHLSTITENDSVVAIVAHGAVLHEGAGAPRDAHSAVRDDDVANGVAGAGLEVNPVSKLRDRPVLHHDQRAAIAADSLDVIRIRTGDGVSGEIDGDAIGEHGKARA